jgi:glutathione S-transferase
VPPQINPLGKVPVLVDGALRLPESPAIVLYLSDRFDLPNHWAPRWPRRAAGGGGASAADSEAAAAARAARFHSALSWQGSSLRGGAMQLLMHRVVGRVFGAPMVPEVAANGLMQLKASLRDLDHYWLDGGRSGFLAGDEISAADLLAACELEQLRWAWQR